VEKFLLFVTKHVLDRQTDRQTDILTDRQRKRPLQYRVLHYMQSCSENDSMHQMPEWCFQFKQ